MSWVGGDGRNRHTRRPGASRVLIAAAVALVMIGAVVLAIRALASGRSQITLSLYANDDGTISAQAQYDCGGGPCGDEGDKLFFKITGDGIKSPTSAKVGSVEITEAVIREAEDGLLVYYDLPAGEPGYSLIDFPCASSGSEIEIEAIVEIDNGAERESATDSVVCPAK